MFRPFSVPACQCPHAQNNYRKCFTEFGVKELHQSAQSPDPNPIKHLWDELRARPYRLTPVMLLCLKRSKIPKAMFKHLVENLPRRAEAVRDGTGEFSVKSHFEMKCCQAHMGVMSRIVCEYSVMQCLKCVFFSLR